MAKQLLTIAVVILVCIAFFNNSAYATTEKGDTLVIHQADQDDTPWNEIVAADTLGDGTHKHLVYELDPDGWYPLSTTLSAGTYDLNVVGGKRTSPEQSRPVVLVAEPFSGWYMVSGGKNITLKGIHWQQCSETIGGNIGQWARSGVELTGVNSKVVFHDMIWDFDTGFAALINKNGLNLKVTNCLFRFNKAPDNGVWAGQGLDVSSATLDTIIIRNCTWYGGGPFMLKTWASAEKKLIIDHVSIVDFVQWPIHGVHWVNTEITNNLFYNAYTMGEDSAQIKGQDPDGLPFGVVDIDTIFSTADSEATRNMLVSNNNNFVSQNIIDYWAVASAPADQEKYHFFVAPDPTFYDGFMNSRSQAMFADDEAWPNLVLKNTTSLDPEFSDYYDYSDTLINYSKAFYSYAWPNATPSQFMLDPDGEPLQPTDPMVYNLKITNETLRSASTNGGPIGDLTWELPNGYNSTQNEIATAIGTKQSFQPSEFTLLQNYPNPFNPATTISFNLPVSEKVTLVVYNALGQKIATILNNHNLSAGMHVYKFNGSKLSSGVYFYRIIAGDQHSSTKKMLLLK
jgi:hypothetical protein